MHLDSEACNLLLKKSGDVMISLQVETQKWACLFKTK